MDTNESFHSAQIFQFPTNGRAGLIGSRALPDVMSPSVARMEFGSAWYHDDAIRETDGRARPFEPVRTDATILQLTFPRQ